MSRWMPQAVAALGGIGFVGFGAWAMLSPRTFFETMARFDPYNQHFIQDIGAFQVGLGAVLLVAVAVRNADLLAAALLGTGLGAALHALSHVIGMDLGGTPAMDIPIFGGLAALLLIAGVVRWRTARV
jgi:hypothetical protein